MLSKLKTSTATKAEVEKAAFLDEQLKDVLRDVRDNKTRATEIEIEKAKTVTSRKTAELHRAIKAATFKMCSGRSAPLRASIWPL